MHDALFESKSPDIISDFLGLRESGLPWRVVRQWYVSQTACKKCQSVLYINIAWHECRCWEMETSKRQASKSYQEANLLWCSFLFLLLTFHSCHSCQPCVTLFLRTLFSLLIVLHIIMSPRILRRKKKMKRWINFLSRCIIFFYFYVFYFSLRVVFGANDSAKCSHRLSVTSHSKELSRRIIYYVWLSFFPPILFPSPQFSTFCF